jgi:formate dehydrogenase subunit delta
VSDHRDADTSMMSNDARLVYMLNQIARNFAAIGHDAASAATADHVASFWDPRMRARIRDLAENDPDALSPAARAALAILATGAPPPQTPATRFASADGIEGSDAG